MIKFRLFLTAVVVCPLFALTAIAQTTAPKPPMTETKPKTTTIHGVTLVDDYFWLREKTNPAVMAHLQAESDYADAMMKPTAPLQEKLYNEMLSHIKQTDDSVPYKWGDYYYYSRTVTGLQYPIYCRKHGSTSAPEEVILDQNELAKGQKFMSVGALTPSDDGNLLAYTTDNTVGSPGTELEFAL